MDRANGDGVAADASVDMENEVLHKMKLEALQAALASLDEASYHIIHALYLSERRMTERGLAEELGVSQPAIHKRKAKIEKILGQSLFLWDSRRLSVA